MELMDVAVIVCVFRARQQEEEEEDEGEVGVAVVEEKSADKRLNDDDIDREQRHQPRHYPCQARRRVLCVCTTISNRL